MCFFLAAQAWTGQGVEIKTIKKHTLVFCWCIRKVFKHHIFQITAALQLNQMHQLWRVSNAVHICELICASSPVWICSSLLWTFSSDAKTFRWAWMRCYIGIEHLRKQNPCFLNDNKGICSTTLADSVFSTSKDAALKGETENKPTGSTVIGLCYYWKLSERSWSLHRSASDSLVAAKWPIILTAEQTKDSKPWRLTEVL